MQRDFAFVQVSPGRLFVGWGPFEQLPYRRPERPAFFISDFFLDEPEPWWHPAEWEELDAADLGERFEPSGPPEIRWEAASRDDFARLFDSVREGMDRGEFQKIVPVLFERGTAAASRPHWRHFLSQVESLPRGLRAYGFSRAERGMVGATPEVLFQSEAHGYRTMALAGTRPVARAEELLSDTKELREHRVVVDDIVRRLSPFGDVEIGPLGLLRLPGIAHLMTPLFFREAGDGEKTPYAEMVRRLHPTAALGVWPRSPAGERWLREADRGVGRLAFGAPFGVERVDRSSLALVAIRNVQWDGASLRIGSGAGLLPESQMEREFEELRQKRDHVKALFHIESAWAISIRHGA